jgi:hypothetical protein
MGYKGTVRAIQCGRAIGHLEDKLKSPECKTAGTVFLAALLGAALGAFIVSRIETRRLLAELEEIEDFCCDCDYEEEEVVE